MISERIKAALARSKKPLGLQNLSKCTKVFLRRLRARSNAGVRKAAMERAGAYRLHIEWALYNRDRSGNPISFSGAAEKLNEQHLPSPMGGRWTWRTIRDIALRLGFPHRVAYVPTKVLQARAHGVGGGADPCNFGGPARIDSERITGWWCLRPVRARSERRMGGLRVRRRGFGLIPVRMAQKLSGVVTLERLGELVEEHSLVQ